jgi:hypothetical protein
MSQRPQATVTKAGWPPPATLLTGWYSAIRMEAPRPSAISGTAPPIPCSSWSVTKCAMVLPAAGVIPASTPGHQCSPTIAGANFKTRQSRKIAIQPCHNPWIRQAFKWHWVTAAYGPSAKPSARKPASRTFYQSGPRGFPSAGSVAFHLLAEP